MKAGANELRALMRYFGEQGLCVPLMCLVDYRGYRLVAVSILPIQGVKTLVYGSADAGRNIFASDDDFNRRMLAVARKINIKPHWCGSSSSSRTTKTNNDDENGGRKWLAAPTDVEGHIGTDGKRYVLDFGRVFPPTNGPNVRQTYLYQVSGHFF